MVNYLHGIILLNGSQHQVDAIYFDLSNAVDLVIFKENDGYLTKI
jgi:hypothetical protein